MLAIKAHVPGDQALAEKVGAACGGRCPSNVCWLSNVYWLVTTLATAPDSRAQRRWPKRWAPPVSHCCQSIFFMACQAMDAPQRIWPKGGVMMTLSTYCLSISSIIDAFRE